MNLEQRTQALLALVEQYRERRFGELLEPAHAEARDTLRSARVDGRRRVSTAIAEERKRRAMEVGAIEAALATDRRLAAQRHAVHLLGGAWHDLSAKLIARWNAESPRAQWIESYLQRAVQAVPTGMHGWRIEYHPSWSEPERTRQRQRLHTEGVGPVIFQEDPGIAAGFRIVGGHNVLDATLDGMLADRTQLEGRLLHHLNEEEHG